MSSYSNHSHRLQRPRSIFLNLSLTASGDSDTTEASDLQVRLLLNTSNPAPLMIIVGESDFLFWDNKPVLRPASKASIDGMPRMVVLERGDECSICLDEYQIGGETRLMPCNHNFHPACIEKWLGIHGSCPICRFAMPSEEKSSGDGEETRDETERRGRMIVIRVGDGPDAMEFEMNLDSYSDLEIDLDSNSDSGLRGDDSGALDDGPSVPEMEFASSD